MADRQFPVWVHFSDDDVIKLNAFNDWTLQSVSMEIIKLKSDYQGRSLRFVHAGKLLSNSQLLRSIRNQPRNDSPLTISNQLSDNNLVSVNSQLRNDDADTGNDADNVPGGGDIIHLQCSIAQSNYVNNIAPNRGLDRLLDLGLSRDEVNSIRSQFHSLRGNTILDASVTDNGLTNHDLRLEDAFLDNDLIQDDFTTELFFNLVLGFFGGIISLLWMTEITRGKLGIVIGLLLNISFSLLRFI
jgi:hypothetical protein